MWLERRLQRCVPCRSPRWEAARTCTCVRAARRPASASTKRLTRPRPAPSLPAPALRDARLHQLKPARYCIMSSAPSAWTRPSAPCCCRAATCSEYCIFAAGGSGGTRFVLSRAERSNNSGGAPLKVIGGGGDVFAQLVQRTTYPRPPPQRTPGPRTTRHRATNLHRACGDPREAVAAAARASRRAQDEVCSPATASPVRRSRAGRVLPTAEAMLRAPTPDERPLERRWQCRRMLKGVAQQSKRRKASDEGVTLTTLRPQPKQVSAPAALVRSARGCKRTRDQPP